VNTVQVDEFETTLGCGAPEISPKLLQPPHLDTRSALLCKVLDGLHGHQCSLANLYVRSPSKSRLPPRDTGGNYLTPVPRSPPGLPSRPDGTRFHT